MTLAYEIASLKLVGKSVERIIRAIDIDLLIAEQRHYLASWREGT